MRILVATSDLTPLLAPDASNQAGVLPGLPLAFQHAGHEVSLVGPLTPAAERSGAVKLKGTGVQINVGLGNEQASVQVAEARTEDGLQLFLLRHEGTFGQVADGASLDASAAVLFSKGLVELARRLNPAPDVLQIQDWAGALAPLLLRTQHLPFASVLSVSDPRAQGSFPIEDFHLLNLGWEHFRPTGVEFYGRLNFLKSGLVAAPAVVADGDLEREALQTSEHGAGLDAVFREHVGKLHGIPHGLDERVWNPTKDTLLARRYQPTNLAGKGVTRNALLAGLGLAKNAVGPVYLLDLVGTHDRAILELLSGQIDQLLAADLRFVVLGQLPPQAPAQIAFETAARKHPTRLALVREPDDRLRHGALAGADFQLFLGRDLRSTDSVLRALKYGTLPIAAASPGLRQLAEDIVPGTNGGSGLVFYQNTRAAIFDVLAYRAPGLLGSEEQWESLRQRAMIHAGKFTWARTAAQYVALYGQLGH